MLSIGTDRYSSAASRGFAFASAAFATRYDTNTMILAGTFSGKLANDGEALAVSDRYVGSLDCGTYADGWYDHSDGNGYSLTRRHPASPGIFDDRNSWKFSDIARENRCVVGVPGVGPRREPPYGTLPWPLPHLFRLARPDPGGSNVSPKRHPFINRTRILC